MQQLKGLKKLIILTLLLLASQSLVACSGESLAVLDNRTNTPAPPLAALLASVTPVISPTATIQPDPTPSPAPTSTAQPSPSLTIASCKEETGNYEIGQIATPLLREPLDFRVYLPPCYQALRDRSYPVLYLIHGQSYTDDQWQRLGAGDIVDQLIASGQAPPFLIVMPRDRVWSQPTEDNFGKAIVEDLIPYIDQNYRTLPDRNYRAVGGLSRGAAWALHLGLSQWELFGAFGGHSLPVFWTDTYHIKEWLSAIPPEQMPRIYLDIGENDRPEIMRSAVWFEDLLTKMNIPHEWYLYPGYHEEKYWQSHLERYLLWYSAPWRDLEQP